MYNPTSTSLPRSTTTLEMWRLTHLCIPLHFLPMAKHLHLMPKVVRKDARAHPYWKGAHFHMPK